MVDKYLQDWLDKNMPEKLDAVEDEDIPIHVTIWAVLIFAICIGMLIGGMR